MKQLRRNPAGDHSGIGVEHDARRAGKAAPGDIGTDRGPTPNAPVEGALHMFKKLQRQIKASASSAGNRSYSQIARMQLREAKLRTREALVSEKEAQLSRREHEVRNFDRYRSAQDNFNTRLRQANEQLVVASVQLQITAEELEKSKAEMAHLAMHDLLTQLPNRLQLDDRIRQAIALAKRHGTKLAVLFVDLDRFKQVNDTFGHAIGDQLLQSVAHRLKGAIRDSDTVSRLGGDEFVLLLSEVGEAEELKQKIEIIHRAIIAPYHIEGKVFAIDAAIGISMFPRNGGDPESLIHNADTAMYCAKSAGFGPYQFFDSIEE